MKIPRSGPLWGLVVGIPCLLICVVGCFAIVVGWVSLDRKCRQWLLEIEGDSQ